MRFDFFVVTDTDHGLNWTRITLHESQLLQFNGEEDGGFLEGIKSDKIELRPIGLVPDSRLTVKRVDEASKRKKVIELKYVHVQNVQVVLEPTSPIPLRASDSLS